MLTQEKLKNALNYNPDTGIFTWLIRPANRITIGDKAGCHTPEGYIIIRIHNNLVLAHRLAWLYVHGVWPVNDIDHINGIRNDNRLENLRDIPRQHNLQNQRKSTQRNKTTGLLGTHKSGDKYNAEITINYKNVYLGRFATAIEAHEAYLSAKRKLHEGCTI